MGSYVHTKESFLNYSSLQGSQNLPQEKQRGVDSGLTEFVSYLPLLQTENYCINDLSCCFSSKHEFKANYTSNFSFTFARTGYFIFESFRQKGEEYRNRITVEKPGCEFRCVQQSAGKSSCTVFSFSDTVYDNVIDNLPKGIRCFFSDTDQFSTIIDSGVVADYLHHRILQLVRQSEADAFEMDCLVAELISAVVDQVLTQHSLYESPKNVRRHHLPSIERAKDFLLENYNQSISLRELAQHCYLSEFHFTRTFKKICGYMPFEYLQEIRLKNAEMLVRNSDLPLTDVAIQSGFSRTDYFSASFSKKYGVSPKNYRHALR